MKKLFLVIWLTLLAGKSFGQVVESWIENKKTFLDTVRVSYEKGKVFMNVTLGEDAVTYRFLLDTGAPCVISENLQRKLNIPLFKRKLTGTSVEGVKDSTSLVVMPTVKIGSVTFKNTLASATSLDYLNSKGLNIDGIIGANLLKLCIWQINLPGKYIIFTDKLSRLAKESMQEGFKFDSYGIQGSPLVKVTYGKIDEAAIIDTGSDILFTMNTRAFKTGVEKGNVFQPTAIRKEKLERGTMFGKIDKDTATFVRLDNVCIGEKLTFRDVDAEVLSDVSLIGTALLEKYVVTLDFIRKKIYYAALP